MTNRTTIPLANDNLLGTYLKDRRAKLDPAAFGLPLKRRRTPGLRREEVAQRANGLPRWLRAHGGYVLSLAPTILTFAPLPMKILTAADGGDASDWTVRSDRPTILAAFANTPVYGGGMRIAPRAKMDDGLLDICIVGAVDRLRLLRLFPTVYSGNHLNVPEVEYFQASRVRVETEHPLDVYADGEYVCRTPVEVRVQDGALKVVTL